MSFVEQELQPHWGKETERPDRQMSLQCGLGPPGQPYRSGLSDLGTLSTDPWYLLPCLMGCWSSVSLLIPKKGLNMPPGASRGRDSVTASEALDLRPSRGFSAALEDSAVPDKTRELAHGGRTLFRLLDDTLPPQRSGCVLGIQPPAPISSCAHSTLPKVLLRFCSHLQQGLGLKAVFV